MTSDNLTELEDRLRLLEAELHDQRAVKARVEADVQAAYLEGRKNAGSLSLAVAEADARINGVEGAIRQVTQQLAEARANYAHERAATLIQEDYAAAYATLSERKKELGVARAKLHQQLKESERDINALDQGMSDVAVEADIVAHRFKFSCDIPRPDRARFTSAYTYEPLDDDRCRVSWKSGGGRTTRFLSGDAGRVLSLAGPLERTEREVLDAMQERNRAEDLRHQQRRDEVDSWLRAALKDGPVERRLLYQQAEQAGISINTDPKNQRASLLAARKRLDIVTLTSRDEEDPQLYWSLPRNFDPDEWKLDSGPQRKSTLRLVDIPLG